MHGTTTEAREPTERIRARELGRQVTAAVNQAEAGGAFWGMVSDRLGPLPGSD